jgi:hypothetical protein
MRPYLLDMSHRPKCSCCVSKDGHGALRNKHSNQTRDRVARTAKRGVRQALKKDLNDRIND